MFWFVSAVSQKSSPEKKKIQKGEEEKYSSFTCIGVDPAE